LGTSINIFTWGGSEREAASYYVRGKNNAINICYVTKGGKYLAAAFLLKLGEVGDHRGFILDFDANLIIGMSLTRIVRPCARKLNYKSDRMPQSTM